MSLKRLGRIQEDVNGIVQDLTPCISTLWTAGLAGASKGYDGILAYILSGGYAWSVVRRSARLNSVQSEIKVFGNIFFCCQNIPLARVCFGRLDYSTAAPAFELEVSQTT